MRQLGLFDIASVGTPISPSRRAAAHAGVWSSPFGRTPSMPMLSWTMRRMRPSSSGEVRSGTHAWRSSSAARSRSPATIAWENACMRGSGGMSSMPRGPEATTTSAQVRCGRSMAKSIASPPPADTPTSAVRPIPSAAISRSSRSLGTYGLSGKGEAPAPGRSMRTVR
jgi:hypothetical protein